MMNKIIENNEIKKVIEIFNKAREKQNKEELKKEDSGDEWQEWKKLPVNLDTFETDPEVFEN